SQVILILSLQCQRILQQMAKPLTLCLLCFS
ncbi:hypothetical protein AVDCRST_MAG94-2616, partial [uncultured Leptolyngbya sp.]